MYAPPFSRVEWVSSSSVLFFLVCFSFLFVSVRSILQEGTALPLPLPRPVLPHFCCTRREGGRRERNLIGSYDGSSRNVFSSSYSCFCFFTSGNYLLLLLLLLLLYTSQCTVYIRTYVRKRKPSLSRPSWRFFFEVVVVGDW